MVLAILNVFLVSLNGFKNMVVLKADEVFSLVLFQIVLNSIEIQVDLVSLNYLFFDFMS
jgi:hypothetical protein